MIARRRLKFRLYCLGAFLVIFCLISYCNFRNIATSYLRFKVVASRVLKTSEILEISLKEIQNFNQLGNWVTSPFLTFLKLFKVLNISLY
jgi:hypothetical protein